MTALVEVASINEKQLRRIAGSSWFRAERLYEEGYVVSIASTGDGVVGEVRGTHLYRTQISLAHGRFASVCTCPLGHSCKHVFALALRWTRDEERGVEIASSTKPQSKGQK